MVVMCRNYSERKRRIEGDPFEVTLEITFPRISLTVNRAFARLAWSSL